MLPGVVCDAVVAGIDFCAAKVSMQRSFIEQRIWLYSILCKITKHLQYIYLKQILHDNFADIENKQ